MKPVIRTPCTPDELIAVTALKHCGFAPASWDKRFVRQLSELGLTDKERPQVWRLFIRYRRQICHVRKAELLALAGTLAAPDFRVRTAEAKRLMMRVEIAK